MKRSGRYKRRYGLGLTLWCVTLLNVGCVERLLQVRSDPPGATVYINGKNAGQTPLDFDFTHYGTVDVILRHEDYLSHREMVALSPPWYEYFPLDFVSEILVPWTINDHHPINVALQAGAGELNAEDVASLRERAQAARATLPARPTQNR